MSLAEEVVYCPCFHLRHISLRLWRIWYIRGATL